MVGSFWVCVDQGLNFYCAIVKITVTSMHERKVEMAKRSCGFVGLPGGFGTFEEVMEVTTWTQIGIHSKRRLHPCISCLLILLLSPVYSCHSCQCSFLLRSSSSTNTECDPRWVHQCSERLFDYFCRWPAGSCRSPFIRLGLGCFRCFGKLGWRQRLYVRF